MVVTLARVDKELIEQLKQRAQEEERTLITVTNKAIREYLRKPAAAPE